jgi:hypothetical protein
LQPEATSNHATCDHIDNHFTAARIGTQGAIQLFKVLLGCFFFTDVQHN